MNMILIALGAVGMVVAFWFINGYNSFVHLKNLVDEAWSGISVQLKRRYDLIPNLVAVVKQYSVHEKEVLENVTRMRSVSMNATDVAQKASAENALTGALKTLFAVSEQYPDLKANSNFLALQKDLTTLEDEIQLSRRYYNGATRNYNISLQSFPGNIIAGMFGFHKAPFFELDSAEEHKSPRIEF